MTPRRGLLLAGLAVSAGLALFGNRTPAGAVAEPTARAPGRAAAGDAADAAAPAPAHAARKASAPVSVEALQARPAASAGDVGEVPAGSTLFVAQTFDPPAPPPSAPVRAAAPSAPGAPPVPFTFVGKKLDAGRWEVYLADGDRTLIARDGSVIDDTWLVASIRPPILILTYLPLKQMQSLQIGRSE